jgi:hypothetical protein
VQFLQDQRNIERVAGSPDLIKALIAFTRHDLDEINDWHTASTEFCLAVFQGQIDFVRKIHPDSYYRLEREWLHDAKQVDAHKAWIARGRGWGDHDKQADYLHACASVCRILAEPTRKASRADFAKIGAYIQDHILACEVRKEAIIRTKAQRLHDLDSGGGHLSDWQQACDYVNTFYGNIINAVVEPDHAKSEQIFNLLTGTRRGHSGPLMANMFEATLFRYFVKYSESKPDPSDALDPLTSDNTHGGD